MKEAALREFKDAHVYISAAAIGDYTPAFRSAKKIKKESERLIIELKRAPDVLKTVGSLKRKGQVVVGFAAETDNLEENAARKMREKNLDLVVGNLVGDGVFGSSDTKVVVISKNSKRELRGSKEEVAEEILKEVYKVLKGGA
jgi:phosphopantothenoylcysteine decarboxylase/phosphopantothenate--cysteine ligase